ncbi:unnamed protein product [Paramecium sonneborni]|uniref:Protein kinase domain-containing protein n=1 Tax=Paramecium sonneborni TaxID=65129 RepID=A0A8S1NU52_9CILI|nr:unnamed protein product [Paramecium sonneborni]
MEGNKINAPSKEFPKRSFLIKEQIGKGGEGVVYLAQAENWDKNFDVALKVQFSIKETESDFIKQLIEVQNDRDEIGSKSYKPTNIIRIYDIFNYQNQTIQVMEVGELNLFRYMKQNKQTLSYGQKIRICYQLLNSISYIHQRGLIHRDIKGENFILVNTEFKLIDFGLLREKNRLITSTNGTRIYQPPEILEQEDEGYYTQSIDVWALGCVFYEIFAEQELFPCHKLAISIQQIKDHKKNQYYVYSLIDQLKVSQLWKELIKQMLHPNYINRLSIKESITKVKFIISQELNSTQDQTGQKKDFDNKSLTDTKLQELNKTIQEQNQIIQQLQSQIQSKEEELSNQKDQIIKLEIENKKFKYQYEQSCKTIKQQADQIQNLQYVQNQNKLQVQQYINQQVSNLNNQFIQSMNSSKLIQENEAIVLKKKIQELEDEKLKLINKLNQSQNSETRKLSQETNQFQQQNTQKFEENFNEQIKFLVNIIGDLNNEIQNLEQSLQGFQSIQKILSSNNGQFNTQIQDLEKLINQKKVIIQNYEKIKQEIQQLSQQKQSISSQQSLSQQKQSIPSQQSVDFDQSKNKTLIKLQSPQEEQSVSQVKQINQFKQIQQQPQIQTNQNQRFPYQGDYSFQNIYPTSFNQ